MKNQRGFTLIELAVVTGVVVILLGFITINLVGSQQGASLASVQEILLVNLKQQQLKAMIGDTEGRSDSDSYGVHFDADKYVLFHGQTYSSADSSNVVIPLDDNMQFNNSGFNIVFSKLSGETSAGTIELQENTTLKLKRIYVNSLGVITQIDSL